MMTRRSHAKSRNGCRTCKQRRVKCDESGPPCTNCAIRGLSCAYGPTLARRSHPETSLQTSNWEVSKPSRKLLELELMHRWSTSTYSTFSTNPAELHVLQVELPRDAMMRYEFMLNGIYAMAALDLAVASVATSGSPSSDGTGAAGQQIYLAAALEYYDNASAGFRAELCRICRDNHHALWYFSFLVAVFHLAVPLHVHIPGTIEGGDGSMLGRMATFFELYDGNARLTEVSFDWLVESSAPVREVLAWEAVTRDLVPADTVAAVDRLRRLNDQVQGGEGGRSALHKLYSVALDWLEICFAEEVKDRMTGYCMVWPGVLGRAFAAALREPEHMALLLLMHWTVLTHRLPPEAWWVQPVGQSLVADVSEQVWESSHASLPEWRPAVTWVRQQVGLPPYVS
ncbi:hypothetical protein NKR23_g1663 [Pleurostoma richardsiae]|uniref:Zn(2)-C6 fungal-type domain-containing protein n=1 Tax=Pleurostoma richardsiae TaxID=41990 RepID=A0AA38RR03_9PEZI|nr:hypothetical protein NKR23_g1663 [Pleurostoma richardsiae]